MLFCLCIFFLTLKYFNHLILKALVLPLKIYFYEISLAFLLHNHSLSQI